MNKAIDKLIKKKDGRDRDKLLRIKKIVNKFKKNLKRNLKEHVITQRNVRFQILNNYLNLVRKYQNIKIELWANLRQTLNTNGFYPTFIHSVE